MGDESISAIYVLQARKGGRIEYWAAATIQDKAVEAVRKRLDSSWAVTLTNKRLSSRRLSALKMGPNRVQRL
jgi:hypothetical protein